MFSEAHRPVVSRLGRLEKVDGPRAGDLSHHARISQNRDLRLSFAIATRGSLGPQQHCGRSARLSTGEFRQFLGNARGSLVEVETQILIARELGYLERDRSDTLLGAAAEVGRILNGLLNSLPSRN